MHIDRRRYDAVCDILIQNDECFELSEMMDFALKMMNFA